MEEMTGAQSNSSFIYLFFLNSSWDAPEVNQQLFLPLFLTILLQVVQEMSKTVWECCQLFHIRILSLMEKTVRF